jgi:LPXTG-site transpeptidase (sortase) family protein
MVRCKIMYSENSFFFTESTIRSFLREAPRRGSGLKMIALFGTLALGVSLSVFFLLNVSSFTRVSDSTSISSLALTTPSPTPVVQHVVASTPTPIPTPTPGPSIPDNTLSIPSLNNLSAPIHWDTTLDEKIIQQNLETGIIHIDHTAKPGQVGTVAITGHSSNYFWDKGSYNTIFAPLQKAAIGGEIDVAYLGKTYVYKITKMYEITPDKVEVLQSTSQSILRVITCTPVGTSLRRLVVEAVQISPNPATNSVFQAVSFSGNIPAAR